jgi:hypothetical protein
MKKHKIHYASRSIFHERVKHKAVYKDLFSPLEVLLSDGVHVLTLGLRLDRCRVLGEGRAVVVYNLPVAIDPAPHVGEASLDGGAVSSDLESVHAGVEVRVLAVALNVVGGDGAGGELLQELGKVLLGGLGVADELGGHGGEERQVGGRVEAGDLLEVLGLEGVVPPVAA